MYIGIDYVLYDYGVYIEYTLNKYLVYLVFYILGININ